MSGAPRNRYLNVYPVPIALGLGSPNELPEARHSLYQWIAEQFAEDCTIRMDTPRETVYLPFEEIHRAPEKIREYIEKAPKKPKRSLFVFDLTLSGYDFLRDTLLSHIGDAAVSMANDPARKVLILLPDHAPPPSSLLWESLSQTSRGNVIVVDLHRQTLQYGNTSTELQSFAREFASRVHKIDGSTRQRLREKTIRRLGHFDLGSASPNGESNGRCGRYFHYGEKVVDELATLATEQVNSRAKSDPDAWRIVVCAKKGKDSWIHEVARIVSEETGVTYLSWPEKDKKKTFEALKKKKLILLYDVVRTGGTAKKMLKLIRGWKLPRVKLILVAIGTKSAVGEAARGIEFEVFQKVPIDSIPSKTCPQCKLGLPHTDPKMRSEAIKELRSFDFWDMVLGSEWRDENYGSETDKRNWFPSIPDFVRVFDRYGDFIGSIYESKLRALDGNEAIVICPEEPAVQVLVKKLSVLYEGRLGVVEIPRPIIEQVRKSSNGEISNIIDAHADTAWGRQLRHHGKEQQRVVMIDEFSGSGKTASALFRLLSNAGLDVIAFLPFVDRTGDLGIGSLRVESLYEIRSPRTHV